MNRPAFVLTALLVSPLAAAAETPYTCGTGMFRDAEAIVETTPQRSVTRIVEKTNKRGEREVRAETSPSETQTKTYRVIVELEDITYTAESSGNFWNFNPTQFVINDPIAICVDKKQIILKRPDGKDYKARIVRAVRNATR